MIYQPATTLFLFGTVAINHHFNFFDSKTRITSFFSAKIRKTEFNTTDFGGAEKFVRIATVSSVGGTTYFIGGLMAVFSKSLSLASNELGVYLGEKAFFTCRLVWSSRDFTSSRIRHSEAMKKRLFVTGNIEELSQG